MDDKYDFTLPAVFSL